jgi:DNA repair exonuclease SbcCD nuclease subunit
MKLLHTSDWHLGHRLLNQAERDLEHQMALDWLLTVYLRAITHDKHFYVTKF